MIRLTFTSLVLCLFLPIGLTAQTTAVDFEPDEWIDARLNTAADATWMRAEEREMVYELNRLRSNPQRYVQFLQPALEEAKADLERYGNERKHYSVSTIYTTDHNGVETVRNDTNWHNLYEEKLHAVEDLIAELKALEPMQTLQPDRGIYKAAQAHAADESRHNWELGHRGSDGSWPSERIRKHAPNMRTGNENIAGKGHGRKENKISPREIVVLLLIDSGIPGYGHRKNILNPEWTHVAPCYGGWFNSMHYWLQEFGASSSH